MKPIFFAFFLSLFHFSVLAQKPTLALTHIPKVMEFGNDKAPYNRFLSAFINESQIKFDYEFMPSSRANKLLNEERIDCIFPIIPTDTRTIITQFSNPINGIRAHIFSLEPKVYTELQQLDGLRVVYLRGYLFGDLIANNKNINFFPVTNQNAALGMLRKKRADAYLDYIPDIRFVFTKPQLKMLKFDQQAPVIEDFDRMECLLTPEGLKLLSQLNKFVADKKQSGQLPVILGDYFVKTD